MSHIVLNYDNFDQTISQGVVLVDFWATWCGPCQMLAPTIDSIANKYEGRVVVGKVDVDDYPDLASRYGIMSIPTLIVFKNGEIVEKMIGYRLEREISSVLDAHLN